VSKTKKEVEKTINNFIESLDSIVKELESKFIALTPKKALNLLTNPTESADFISQLTDLQTLYGLVVSMHPENIYEKESKERTIFENILSEVSELSKFVESALEVYHLLKSRILAPIGRETYCYSLMVNVIEGTRWSFYGLMLQIISKSKKILGFFRTLASAEYEKGKIVYYRKKGKVDISKTLTLEEIEIPPPPSVRKKLKEQKGDDINE